VPGAWYRACCELRRHRSPGQPALIRLTVSATALAGGAASCANLTTIGGAVGSCNALYATEAFNRPGFPCNRFIRIAGGGESDDEKTMALATVCQGHLDR
jgi:hypothetical protein